MFNNQNTSSLRYKFCQGIRQWLSSPFSESLIEVANEAGISKWPVFLSGPLDDGGSSKRDGEPRVPVALIQQFYLPTDTARLAEIRQTLALNAANSSIDKIVLLNERIYTNEELGVDCTKVTQVVIGHRLTYKDALDYAYDNLGEHVVVLSNSDIFFDASIGGFAQKAGDAPVVLTQLRYEFDPRQPLSSAKHEALLTDCQDTWVWRTDRFYISPEQRKAFDFPLGKAGCDNRVVHLFAYTGAKVVNDPQAVRTYHNHTTGLRNWQHQDRVQPPYLHIAPFAASGPPAHNAWAFDPYDCQRKLHNFLSRRIGSPVLIPRSGGKAMHAAAVAVSGRPDECRQILQTHFSFNPGPDSDMYTTVHALLGAVKTCEQRFWTGASSDETTDDRVTYAFSDINFKQPAFDVDLCAAVAMTFHKERWTDLLTGKKVCLVTDHRSAVDQASSARIETVGFDAFKDCEVSIVDMPRSRDELPMAVDAACKSDVIILDGGVLANEIASIAFSAGKWALSMGPQALTLFGVMPQSCCATSLSTSIALRPHKEWVVV